MDGLSRSQKNQNGVVQPEVYLSATRPARVPILDL
jgi:hypothetical protein